MTAFEYITIATSLILSFSFARTTSRFAPIFLSNSRYWVHSSWVAILVVNHLVIFFGTATNQPVEAWSFGRVCGVLVLPVCTLIVSSLAVPNNRSVRCYASHFETIRVPFYAVWAVSIIASAKGVYALGYRDPLGLAILIGTAAPFLAGAVARSSAFDKALVMLTAACYAILLSTIWDSQLFDPKILKTPF
ncbi:MAG: hypothetical protein AAFY44_12300 [Pseudomonadota bacterium]